MAKEIVGETALAAGLVPGFARGAWHTVKGAYDGALFASRLIDPSDPILSPRGKSAWEEVFQAGKGVGDYTVNALLHPKKAANDASAALHRFQVETDPLASPQADTLLGEAGRQFNIGLNQGEFGFDVGSLFVGGAEAKALAGASKVSEAARAAGDLRLAKYFEEPYGGMGHHFATQRAKLPAWLGGGPLPDWIGDSPFFLLKPSNMTKGEFFELHYGVDPHYHGGNVPKKYGGGGWSGKELGWKKHGRPGRLWHGSPAPLKAAVGAGVAGVGAAVDQSTKSQRVPR